jgi:putrescine aminotransferase
VSPRAESAWWQKEEALQDEGANRRAVLEYAEHVAQEHVRSLLGLGMPLSAESGVGPYILDADAQRHIDLRSGGGVFPFGHRPVSIIAALVQATAEVDLGDWQLPSSHRTTFARDLSATMADGSWQWRFFTSGSEGNEFALRTALMTTGRDKLVCFKGGYHGQTGFAAAVTDERHLGRPYPGIAAEVIRIDPQDQPKVERQIDAGVAAVILEPVQLTDGIREIDYGVLRAVRERCDRTGAVLIFDEVKCGLNRTGRLWAHQGSGVIPDLIVAGKALSGGVYPVATVGMRVDGLVSLSEYVHDARSSYGGGHLAMAVGRAALSELAAPTRRSEFVRCGDVLEAELDTAFGKLPARAAKLRRLGMAFEIEIGDSTLALFVAADLLHRRVIVPFPMSSRIVLIPPLTLTGEAAHEAAMAIAASIQTGRVALSIGPTDAA